MSSRPVSSASILALDGLCSRERSTLLGLWLDLEAEFFDVLHVI